MKKQTQNEKCLKKAKETLNDFIKVLEKKGFTEEIKKHLILLWQKDKILFPNAVKGLKDIKFKVENVKFIERHDPELIYRFLTEVNGIETHLFVQPLKEGNIPSKDGKMGVIASKLMKFIPKPTEEEKGQQGSENTIYGNFAISKEEAKD